MSDFSIRRTQCSTCIYRPDSPLDLAKLEADAADEHIIGHYKSYRVCHHSKSACCRGFWDRHKDNFDMGQIAQRLGLVDQLMEGATDE